MRNEFEVMKSSPSLWDQAVKMWRYDFHIRFTPTGRSWDFPVWVEDELPEEDRNDKAKGLLLEFVEGMHGAVEDWRDNP